MTESSNFKIDHVWKGNFCKECGWSLVQFEEEENMENCWECETKKK